MKPLVFEQEGHREEGQHGVHQLHCHEHQFRFQFLRVQVFLRAKYAKRPATSSINPLNKGTPSTVCSRPYLNTFKVMPYNTPLRLRTSQRVEV